MIKEFLDKFMENKNKLADMFAAKHPAGYIDIVGAVISILYSPTKINNPSATRIHQIDDGDFKGTLVFVIGAEGNRPNDYWYVKIYYGSCSGCDTLESIRHYRQVELEQKPTLKQVDDYITLALHIVQGLRAMP